MHQRLAAGLIAFGALLSLVLVMHHPVLHPVREASPEDIAAQLWALSGQTASVHGALMVVEAAQALGFYYFAASLGPGRPVVLGGLGFYVASIFILIVPATLDGFVGPGLAQRCVQVPARCGSLLDFLGFVSISIQAFTKIALGAQAIGLLSWSIALISGGTKLRWVGAIGALLAVCPLLILILGSTAIDPARLSLILAFQAVWALGAAVLLYTDPSAMNRANASL